MIGELKHKLQINKNVKVYIEKYLQMQAMQIIRLKQRLVRSVQLLKFDIIFLEPDCPWLGGNEDCIRVTRKELTCLRICCN